MRANLFSEYHVALFAWRHLWLQLGLYWTEDATYTFTNWNDTFTNWNDRNKTAVHDIVYIVPLFSELHVALLV